MLEGCSETNTAARQADEYIYNGFDDWYLPTIGDWIQLAGFFAIFPGDDLRGEFWTSSEVDGDLAFVSTRDRRSKSEIRKVRAIRTFQVPLE